MLALNVQSIMSACFGSLIPADFSQVREQPSPKTLIGNQCIAGQRLPLLTHMLVGLSLGLGGAVMFCGWCRQWLLIGTRSDRLYAVAD